MDVDGSGSVEFPEFCVMMVKKMRESDIENEVSTKKNKILLFFSGGGGSDVVSSFVWHFVQFEIFSAIL